MASFGGGGAIDGKANDAASAVGGAVRGFQTRRKIRLAEAGVEKNAQVAAISVSVTMLAVEEGRREEMPW